jgi:spore maturation protein CgeB
MWQWIYRAGGIGLDRYLGSRVAEKLKHTHRYDLAFVDSGDIVGPRTIGEIRQHSAAVINFNLDNPFVPRDKMRWRQFKKSVSKYDLIVTPRASTVSAALAAGAKRAIQITQAADEILHRPLQLLAPDLERFSSKVVFVGTWMPERGSFMAELIERDVPLRIYGAQWHKAAEFGVLKEHLISGWVESDDYVKAIAGAKIALALVSRENLDLHTTRSVEIPAIGTLLCGQRTADHASLYQESIEAEFFDDAQECADKCLNLLSNEGRLASVASAGHRRCLDNGHFNERLLSHILSEVGKTD